MTKTKKTKTQEEREETQTSIELQFTGPLVSKNKTLNNASNLKKRLNTLFEELRETQLDNLVKSSLDKVKRELLDSILIKNSNATVKAITACCLADIMRLSVPDEPYTNSEFEIVFSFILSQLKQLGKDEGLDKYYSYLLESLTNVKSARLVVVVNSDNLLLEYFQGIFQLISGRLKKEYQSGLLDILEQIIQQLFFEDKDVPTPVLEVIFSKFNEKVQFDNPALFSIVKNLCIDNADSLQPSVSKYFSELITPSKKVYDEEEEQEKEKEDISKMKQGYKLIKSINSVAPKILLSVIPQLEACLNSEKSEYRQMATEVLGSMFSSSNFTLDSSYKSIWKNWLRRRFDKTTAVRVVWVSQCEQFYKNNSILLQEVNKCLDGKVLDQDEKVRVACCNMIKGLNYIDIKQNAPKSLLQAFGDRIRDKKKSVRNHVISFLGNLYNDAFEDLVNNDILAVEKFGWIPSAVLEAVYTNDKEIILLCETSFRSTILKPLHSQTKANRLLYILSNLSDKAYTSVIGFLQKQQSLSKDLSHFINICKKIGGEIKSYKENDEQLYLTARSLATRITSFLPNDQAASELLSKYPTINDPKFNSLVENIVSGSLSIAKINEAESEAIRKIEAVESAAKDAFKYIFMKLSPSLIHSSLISPLLNKVKQKYSNGYERLSEGNKKLCIIAEKYLKDVSEIFPTLFSKHVNDISDLLSSSNGNMEIWLKIYVSYCRAVNKKTAYKAKLSESLIRKISYGTPQEAKYSALAISYMEDTDKEIDILLNKIVKGFNLDDLSLASHMKALAQFVKTQFFYVDPLITDILEFILKSVLIKNPDIVEEADTLITETTELPREIQVKLYSISFLVNRIDFFAAKESMRALAKPVFKLLWNILENNGEIAEDNSTPDIYKSHLRLKAANSILKLVRHSWFASYIPPKKFILLAATIQDEYYHVREGFGDKLMKYLLNQQLSTKYTTILFYAAFDIEPEFRNKIVSFAKNYLNANKIGKKSAQLIESTIARLIHLLAHDTDFTGEPDDFKLFSKYFEFFLDCIATPENISYIYSVACRVKNLEDVVEPTQTEKLYQLSDLCQYVINIKKNSHHWVVETYPGEIQLSAELFKALPLTTATNDRTLKSYLPPGLHDESFHFMKPPNEFKEKVDKTNISISKSKSRVPVDTSAEEPTKKRKGIAWKPSTTNMPAGNDCDQYLSNNNHDPTDPF